MSPKNSAPPPSVGACLLALEKENSSWDGVVARRDNSRIHRARSGNVDIAIKECFRQRSATRDPALAEREFNALRRVVERARQQNGPPPVPTPLALCLEHASYAMTWIEGCSATQALMSMRGRADARRVGAAAGGWLRNFHSLHRLPARRVDFREKVVNLRRIGATIGRESWVEHTVRMLTDTADAASDITLPASWIHGDMKSDNLLVHGSNVTGIDVHAVDENVVIYDLAPFLNHLGLLRWTAAGVSRGSVLQAVAECFLDAYSESTKSWTRAILWLRAYLLLQAAGSAQRRPIGRLRAWPARMELKSVLASLSAL